MSVTGGGMETGYLHPLYAESLAEFGAPHLLTHSAGWVLRREIPRQPRHDLAGCYPMFSCRDPSLLRLDLEEIKERDDGAITLSLVTDPFGVCDEDYLRECFGDVVVPFKEHFVRDLTGRRGSSVHPHHLRAAERARRAGVTVELCAKPADVLDDWLRLYANLIARHGIKGIRAFSAASFAKQLRVPGVHLFRATHDGETTIGVTVWYVQDGVGYYHLGAYDAAGYASRASFALFSYAIEHFAERGLRWLNFGAGAGVGGDGSDGLSRFKKGWATGTRTAYFCGRIYDREEYARMTIARNEEPTSYFPAYRRGEFT